MICQREKGAVNLNGNQKKHGMGKNQILVEIKEIFRLEIKDTY